MKKIKPILSQIGQKIAHLPDGIVMSLTGIIGLLVSLFLLWILGNQLSVRAVGAFITGAIFFTAVCLLMYAAVEDGRMATETHDLELLWLIPTTYVVFLIFWGTPFAAGFAAPLLITGGLTTAGPIFGICFLGAAIPTAATIIVSWLVWLITPFIERRRNAACVREVLNG